MALESGSYIGDLVTTNPAGSDAKSQGDNHLRLIKTALKSCFAGFSGAVLVTGTDGGAADAYTVTPASALPGYVSKMSVLWSPTATNLTTSPTINISGLGAVALKDVAGNNPVAGDYVAGKFYIGIYDGTNFRNSAITKNYVDQLVFSSSLPSQTGNSGKTITTDGSTASWSALKTLNGAPLLGSGDISLSLVLLATLTPTAAANVDFLSTFTADYDTVIIKGRGILPSSTDAIQFRMANSGVVDAGSNYTTAITSTAATTTTATRAAFGPNVYSSGKGVNFNIEISNVNDASGLKSIVSAATSHESATPSWAHFFTGVGYFGAAASGGRLFWSGGANFAAQGKIYIFGVRNT